MSRNLKSTTSAVNATGRPKAGDDTCDQDCDGGGLVGTARGIMRILAQSHMITETLRDAVLPGIKSDACGDDRPAPDDLSTLLTELNESVLLLRDKLAGLRETVRG